MTRGTRSARRITLVVHSLSAGGVQRVMASMANHWAAVGQSVTMLTLSSGSDDFFFLHPEVERNDLDLLRNSTSPLAAIRSNWQRVRRLRQALRQSHPDVVISFMDKTNVLVLLAARGLRAPVIVSERTDPRHHVIGSAWSWLRRKTYPSAAAVVVQTAAIEAEIKALAGRAVTRVIHNGVAVPRQFADPGAKRTDETDTVVALGRLEVEKGFDLLIESWGKIEQQHPDWRLRIYGEGPEAATLQQVARECARGRVDLAGWTESPEEVYCAASVFALPSRYEGFPNALLEAMACGLPAVSFDCDSGPREIVRPEVDGLLVEPQNTVAFAEALDRLLRDSDLRRQLGNRAKEAAERFSLDKFYQAWEELIGKVL